MLNSFIGNTDLYSTIVFLTGVVGFIGANLEKCLLEDCVDIIPGQVEKINNKTSLIQDDHIERFLNEEKSGERELDLNATLDAETVYSNADFVIVAAPINHHYISHSI